MFAMSLVVRSLLSKFRGSLSTHWPSHIVTRGTTTTISSSILTTQLDVVECSAKGSSVRRHLLLSDLCDELSVTRLSIRDLRLFVHNPSSTLPVILSRPSYGCFLLSLNQIRLICNAQKVVVLNPDLVVVQTFVHNLVSSLAQDDQEKCQGESVCSAEAGEEDDVGHGDESVCFEVLVLDRALGCVTSKLRRHLRLLTPVLELLLRETSSNPSSDMLLRLLAFRKALNAFESRVSTTRSAVKEVMMNRVDLQGLLFVHCQKTLMELEFVLEAHETDLRLLELDLRGMQEQIDDTNDFINTHLNATRNGIIRLSLLMDMGTLAVGSGALVAGVFGMNLVSSLENHTLAFLYVSFGIVAIISTLFALFVSSLARLKADTSQARTLQALRHFLGYVEHLDDIMQAQRHKQPLSIDRNHFRSLLGPAMGDRVNEQDLENIFRILDGNRDGKLDWRDQ